MNPVNRILIPLVFVVIGLPSGAGSNADYGDLIKETPEYKKIITPKPDDDDDNDNRNFHRHFHHYDHRIYVPDYPPTSRYTRPTLSGRYVRAGTFYVGLTIGESEFDYGDIDNGDASIFRIGYRPDNSRLGYELSVYKSGNAEVASLTDIELEVETINLAVSVNSSRNSRSRLNLFAQGGIYLADTTLSGPFDKVSENSNGFLLAAGIEVMLNKNFSIKAEASNLFDVEDFANDETISTLNFGGQLVF